MTKTSIKTTLKNAVLCAIATLLCTTIAHAQGALAPRKSPMTAAQCTQNGTYIRVIYSQPSKNDRVIFGSLVPYSEVWRTGANEATEITFGKDVSIAGKKVKAGTYSLFTIPEEKRWTVILNTELGMWGAFNYDIKKDVLRTTIAPTSTGSVVWEPFTIKIEQGDKAANLMIFWDKTQVTLPIKTLK
jgi:hypothetical protein